MKIAIVRVCADPLPATPKGESSAVAVSSFSKESENLDFYMKPPEFKMFATK